MQRILVVLNQVETARALLTASELIAARLPGSRLDIIHPRPAIDPDFLPLEEVMTDDRRAAFEARRDGITRHLRDAMMHRRSDGSVQRLAFQQRVGDVHKIVCEAASSADLLLIGSCIHGDEEARQELDAALFDAEAPTLIVPSAVPHDLGTKICVAWEQSNAADEAIAAALPLLLAASEVTILVAREGHEGAGLPTGMLKAFDQRGPRLKIHNFDLDGRGIGTALLAEARGLGADLLVMGAFTHSRLRETLFGGATRAVLAQASIPVLMHH